VYGYLKRDEVTGVWRKLHKEELNDLYSTHNIVRVIKWRRMRWAGHVARMVRGEACTGFWWVNLREREPLERPRRRWDDNIKMDFQEVGCGVMETGLSWLRIEIGGGLL
jgi:hypothetical protein